jgi:hypothetical protein
MQGLGERDLGATTQLHEQLKSSRVGQRWERMLRLHAHEVEAVLAVHTDVREAVSRALSLLTTGAQVDDTTTLAIQRVMDHLQRFASVPLQRDLTRMRDELILARGRTLQELLVD